MRRTGIITLIAVVDIVGSAFGLLLGLIWSVAGLHGGREVGLLVLGLLALVVSGVTLATAIGLLQLKGWARTSRIVLASLGLIGVPCGTLVSLLVLLYLLKPGVKVLFSGRSAEQLTPQEAQDVGGLQQSSTVVVVVVSVVCFLAAVAMIGIVAAIAIPSLLRARIAANEADAIGDLRTVVSSEVVYQQANGGRYGTLECLAAPSSCVTGFAGQPFINSETAKSVKQGYQRTLTLSPDAQHYMLVAVPVTPGGTGTRAFCATETGLICQAPAVGESSSPQSLCDPQRCTPL
jgi:hypothetical protein